MALVAQAFLWTGSQIPVYLLGAVPPYIYRDIGGHDRWIWLVLANLLSLAAVCPFVGSLSDLFGRRYVAISGAAFIVLGMIIVSTGKHRSSPFTDRRLSCFGMLQYATL
jgi:MFS family permease